jgi:hypothetical protein
VLDNNFNGNFEKLGMYNVVNVMARFACTGVKVCTNKTSNGSPN